MLAVTAGPAGTIRFPVHVQPRAKRTETVGLHGDALKVRLQAPPVDGAANEELTRYLADALGRSHASVVIVSGHASRRKVLEVPEETRAVLLDLAAG